jgi:hypothetical protein
VQLAYPPDLGRSSRSRLTAAFIELEPRLSSLKGASWAVAYVLVILLAVVTHRGANVACPDGETFQITPSPVTDDEAIASAFGRAIERDSAAYDAYRNSLKRSPEAEDPAAPTNDDDLFEGLTRYRASLGV